MVYCKFNHLQFILNSITNTQKNHKYSSNGHNYKIKYARASSHTHYMVYGEMEIIILSYFYHNFMNKVTSTLLLIASYKYKKYSTHT